MGLGFVEISAGLGALLLALYYYFTKNFDYWEKIGVKGPRPIPLLGNLKDVALGKIHLDLLLQRFYDEYETEPLVGIFARSSPILLVRDLKLIGDVLIKDFNSFPDRGVADKIDEKDPFIQHLVNLEYERWRPLRNKLTPIFTSMKLKNMFYLIAECAQHFEKHVEKLVQKEEVIECGELTAKYTTDTIGACVFGLSMNALDDEESAFRKAGKDLMANTVKNILPLMLCHTFSRIFDLLKPYSRSEAEYFIINTVHETIDYRKNNNIRRNDFVDLLVDLRDQPDKLNDFKFTDAMLTSQAMIFFLAGFETSSMTMSNALYELALNQEIQNKLREEVKEVIKEGGKLTYENIKQMKYLDKVFKETMRKYPVSTLYRKTSVPYTFVGTEITVPKDCKVVIPVWGIHHDPKYYPDPDLFDPERFSEENQRKRHPMSYLAFGDGPRNCIASQFGNYQSKVGIATLINNFKIDVCDKTCIPYRVNPRSFLPAPIGGVYLKIAKL